MSEYRPALFRIAERLRWDAVHASVAADLLHPLPGHSWRPACCWCVSSLEAVLGGDDIDAYRINLYSNHDTGCCSFCGYSGRDTLVARIADGVFRQPSIGATATPLVPDAGPAPVVL